MTQARLAEAAGIAEQSLSRLERGFYEPALSSAWAIAQALGVTLDQLVDGSAQPRLRASERTDVTRLAERAMGLNPRIVSVLSRLVGELESEARPERTVRTPAGGKRRPPAVKATAKSAAAKPQARKSEKVRKATRRS